jgi:hypothetical protein
VERKEIHCTIDDQGNMTFEIKGVKGSSCKDLADVLKRLGRPLSEHRTVEYYQQVRGHARATVSAKK